MMEGAGQRGTWRKKAPVGTILLLMCMFIPTLTLLQTSEEVTCEPGEYATEEGICCNKCSPGFKLEEKCQGVNQRSKCKQCPVGQYADEMNYAQNCRRCRRCKGKHDLEVSPCQRHQNTICRCEAGYYKFVIDSETYDCRTCKKCGPDEMEKQSCTPEKNTVCECKQNYYKFNGKCEPCKNCTAECKHHCSTVPVLTVTGPEPGHGYLINIITAVGVVAVVSLVLVVLITYVATKRSTEKKLLKPSCQPSDVSQDSCQQVLIQSDEPSENRSVKAVPASPVNEPEPSNLPDCVPLEIKIPDLIYTVLDLVPVLQVKQLVRSLGVTDTEIEQAELDHRSCREAHYQMLRVWAERGSAGRGRGRMLHMPLLQELLDELREMHLGRAAEELETEYGIQ